MGMRSSGTAHRFGVDVNFEASVGGGIPLIRSIKEGLVANRIQSIFGILNGTSNYILSKMTDEGRNFQDVLKEAQAKGYAEADPTYDVEGIDAAHKLAILIRLAFGTPFRFKEVFIGGISEITPLDIQFSPRIWISDQAAGHCENGAREDGGPGSSYHDSWASICFRRSRGFSMPSISKGMRSDLRSSMARAQGRCPRAVPW